MIMEKLEDLTITLLTNKLITNTTGPLSTRTKRNVEKAAKKARDILKRRKDMVADLKRMKIGLRWSDDQVAWARNIKLALEEFRQKYSDLWPALDEIITKHRNVRRAYIEFEGKLPKEFYLDTIRDVMEGTTHKEAEKIYESILIMEKRLEKEKDSYYVILPE